VTRPAVFRPQAERELLAAERWYEARQTGLGQQFRSALDRVIIRISEQPLTFPLVGKEQRRALVPRFPYALYFALVDDQAVIVSVIHGHRDPAVWKLRR
jgi:plasmid stabilization system protein ParE